MALTPVPTITSMGYQALLFCPDDKTARTVTQVLSELEFTVEACTEPFAAVKKLMGEHFDAVVVDCDNEQNATLLFKSARNSTSNQTSLAVAVVEGQAGVAKAFRIGANLVLTKPINIEQAKGTLRVARGLLRKSDPAKPGSATATGSFAVPVAPTPTPAATPAPPKQAAAKIPAAKPGAPSSLPPKPVGTAPVAAKPAQVPAQKPATPAWPAASAKPAAPAQSDNIPAPAAERPATTSTPALYNAAVATPVTPKQPAAHAPEIKPVASSSAVSGAASAPAPAREPVAPKHEEKAPAAGKELFERPAQAAQSESAAYVGLAPSFGYGASSTATESGGGNKKIFIGVAAALLIAVGGYFGWSHFKSSGNATAQPIASAPTSTSATTKPANVGTEPVTPAPVPQADVTLHSSSPSKSEGESNVASTISKPSASSTKPAASSSAPAKSAVSEKQADDAVEQPEEKPETPALVVKNGKAPAVESKPAVIADAAPPSMIGMGAPDSTSLPNLGTSDASVKPLLQTLSVSQGVSQGLLYKKVAPVYPTNALRMHIEGAVELMATISKNGDITKIKVISGDAQLARAATDAVKQWKYKPYLLNGEPVEIQTQVTVNFKLPR